jgi:hypothetical protein
VRWSRLAREVSCQDLAVPTRQDGDIFDEQMRAFVRRLGNDRDQRDRPPIVLKQIDDMVDHSPFVIHCRRFWLPANHSIHF